MGIEPPRPRPWVRRLLVSEGISAWAGTVQTQRCVPAPCARQERLEPESGRSPTLSLSGVPQTSCPTSSDPAWLRLLGWKGMRRLGDPHCQGQLSPYPSSRR